MLAFAGSPVRYENSVTLRGKMCDMSARKAPGRSGTTTETIVSDESARSETNRRRSKSILAPEAMATKVWSRRCVCETNRLRPAMARAPAGSSTQRVSKKPSLIASQISSVVTVTMSSTSSLAMRNVSWPTVLTAAPSAKIPTLSSVTRRPARIDAVMPAASSASTPITITPGRTRLTYAAIPASIPPPPQQTKTASSLLPVICLRISMPIVPWPAMTYGSSNGWISVRPSSSTSRIASACASSYEAPWSFTFPLSLRTPSTLIPGVP
mmetsp:Transcript_31571/g.82528  ORF Transcript_31571/g.82528 Transcript_31571/m.82528 type:complete len:268 (+) Transcript_31571:767-1570(+)